MDGWITIGTELETKSFEKQIAKLERQLNDYVSDLEQMSKEEGFNEQSEEVLELKENIEKLTNKLGTLEEKQAELNKSGMSNIKQNVNDISNGTENILKKVARWGLAIFGVRSAYMFIRQSMSTLSQYNEKIGADIQYIRFALASSLQPLIEGIIQLVYKLLTYIGYIAKAWFGVNLFANASVKAFQKVNKGVKDTNKSAKQLQKTLLGFDEANILQDSGDTAKGGGGGGVALPTNDLSDLSNIEIPSWVEWIAQNGELIKNIVIGIGEAFLTWKLLKWASDLGAFTTGLGLLNTLLVTGGIVAILIGISNAVQDVITFIGDPSWSNFYSIIGDLSTALLGLSAILIGINASNPLGWITLGISAIGLLVSTLKEDEQQTLSTTEATKQLKEAQENVGKATDNYTSALKRNTSAKKQLEELEKKAKQSGKELYNQVLLGIISFDDMTDTQKELYGKYLDSLQAEEDLKKKTLELQQANDKATTAEQKKAAAVYASTGKYTDYFNTLVQGYEDGRISSQKMENAVTNIMQNLDEDTRKTFAQNLPNSIKGGFQKTLDELGRTDLKIKDVSSGIEISYKEIASSTKTTFETNVPNSIQKSINKVDSLTKSIDNLRKKGNVKINVSTTTSSSSTGMATGGILKLASGAVINNPGRGVPLRSGVVGGEAGREGILPLTDQQAMAQLGYEIGRNVVINTTLINQMNARTISRELIKTNNEDTFAFNG